MQKSVKKEVKIEPSKPKNKKPLPRLGVSIKLGNRNVSQESGDEGVASPAASYGQDTIDVSKLEKAWQEFARKQEKFIQQTLQNAHPHVQESNRLVITLENIFQRDKINDIKSDLMPYLRAELHNDDLALEIIVSEDVETHKAYTPREKLEEMMKDNPALVKLIKEFDLELE